MHSTEWHRRRETGVDAQNKKKARIQPSRPFSLAITSSFYHFFSPVHQDFQDDSGLLLEPCKCFWHLFEVGHLPFIPAAFLPPETLKIKTTLRRTNVILMSLGVWGMDSKVCLLAECYNFSNLPSSAYSFLPNLIDVSLNRQRCNRSAPLPMAT